VTLAVAVLVTVGLAPRKQLQIVDAAASAIPFKPEGASAWVTVARFFILFTTLFITSVSDVVVTVVVAAKFQLAVLPGHVSTKTKRLTDVIFDYGCGAGSCNSRRYLCCYVSIP
jgi:hypothetical protein